MMALNLPAEETLSEISIEEGYVFQLRVSSSDIAKEYFLNVLKNSEKKVRIALPYEATGITTVVLKPDGYKFSGKVRFCDGGEEFPFEYRTNSYGMYVSSSYPGLQILPVYPLNITKTVIGSPTRFEWKLLSNQIVHGYDFWLGTNRDALHLIASQIANPYYEMNLENLRFSGALYWKVEGYTRSEERFTSPVFSFTYQPSAMMQAIWDAESEKYDKFLEKAEEILDRMKEISDSSDKISKLETEIATLTSASLSVAGKIDTVIGVVSDLSTELSALSTLVEEKESKTEDASGTILSELKAGFSTMTTIASDTLSIAKELRAVVVPSLETLDTISSDVTSCVAEIQKASLFWTPQQKTEILAILADYATPPTIEQNTVVDLFYELLDSLTLLKKVALLKRLSETHGESWLFTGVEGFTRFVQVLFSGELWNAESIPFVFEPYSKALDDLLDFYISKMKKTPTGQLLIDPLYLLPQAKKLLGLVGAKHSFCHYSIEYYTYHQTLRNNETIKGIISKFWNGNGSEYKILLLLNYLIHEYTMKKNDPSLSQKINGDEFLSLYRSMNPDIEKFFNNERNKNYGTSYCYTLGWWELVWADIWTPDPQDQDTENGVLELEKSYNAFITLFPEATVPSIASKTVKLIGTPAGKEATETYVLHEDLTVEAAYGFLKTIEYIYTKGKEKEEINNTTLKFDKIADYRKALIQYLYQKGGFKTADSFIKYLEKYAFETPVKVTKSYIESIMPAPVSNSEPKEAPQ